MEPCRNVPRLRIDPSAFILLLLLEPGDDHVGALGTQGPGLLVGDTRCRGLDQVLPMGARASN